MRHRVSLVSLVAAAVLFASPHARSSSPATLDQAGEKWVKAELKKLTLDEKIGQMIVSSFYSSFMSTDSAEFDTLVRAVHEYKVGGFHVFGATELAPQVLLNPAYGTVILGQPLEAASILNRAGITTGPQRLFTKLSELGWIYRGEARRWRPYAKTIDAGYMSERAMPPRVDHDGILQPVPPQVRITARGLERLRVRLGVLTAVEVAS